MMPAPFTVIAAGFFAGVAGAGVIMGKGASAGAAGPGPRAMLTHVRQAARGRYTRPLNCSRRQPPAVRPDGVPLSRSRSSWRVASTCGSIFSLPARRRAPSRNRLNCLSWIGARRTFDQAQVFRGFRSGDRRNDFAAETPREPFRQLRDARKVFRAARHPPGDAHQQFVAADPAPRPVQPLGAPLAPLHQRQGGAPLPAAERADPP